MSTILIVDDEVHILRVTAMWLHRHGYESVEATNGCEALELFDRHETSRPACRIDLIVSDMNMPIMTGLDLVKAIREDRHSDVPFLLLSARCDRQDLANELRPYDVRLYPKPFVPSRLVADIQEMLCGQQKEGAVQ